jgi:ABC-type transport system involved in cytochrome c biogenesis permease component
MPPVLQRELRAAARQWPNYWLRVLAGGLALLGGAAVLLFWHLERPSFGVAAGAGMMGGTLFLGLHAVLLAVLGLVCPVLTADCLSRERREGTLGLLFLTPLTPGDIVLGKVAMQIVRALSLWLAVVPTLAVPFLLGGVTARDFAVALAAQLTVLLAGLAAGLLATRVTRTWSAAMASAAIFGFGLALLLDLLGGGVFYGAFSLLPQPSQASLAIEGAPLFTPGLLVFGPAAHGALGGSAGVPAEIMKAGYVTLATLLTASGAAFLGAWWWVRRTLARHGAETPPQRAWSFRRRPVAAAASPPAAPPPTRRQRRAQRRRDRQPILWLHLRPAGSWVMRTGWLALVLGGWVIIGAFALKERDAVYAGWFFVPLLLLALTFAAAGSYRQEIEEGTLELLLVTTLPPERLVSGRVRALWGLFRWPLFCALALPLLTLREPDDPEGWLALLALAGSTFFTLPFVGVRCALRRLNPLFGWLIVGLWGVAWPALVAWALYAFCWGFSLFDGVHPPVRWITAFVLAQAASAAWWRRLTVQDLATRDFLRRPFARR